jgi:hypothetical protein
MVKVTMLYNNNPQPALLTGPAGLNLPPQGSKIESTGVAGNSTRKIFVFESYGEQPDIFDATLFSESSISK